MFRLFYTSLIKGVRSFIAPFYCAYCRRGLSEPEPLCSSCVLLIQPILSVTLSISHDTSVQVHALSVYEEPLKTLILAKNRSQYEVSQHLGTLIASHLVMSSMQADYLIPVPLHPYREAQRGYNQARVIAKRVSHLCGIPLLDCMRRLRNTRPQSHYTRIERYSNVKGAFEVTNGAVLEGKNIILVDDLMTSGATLGEMARVLMSFKPSKLRGMVVCGPVDL